MCLQSAERDRRNRSRLSAGKSVVISLVGTGEARTREQVARATAAGGLLEDLDFSPREVIRRDGRAWIPDHALPGQ